MAAPTSVYFPAAQPMPQSKVGDSCQIDGQPATVTEVVRRDDGSAILTYAYDTAEVTA